MTSHTPHVGWTAVVAALLLIIGAASNPAELADSSDTYTKTVIEGDNLLIVYNGTESPDLTFYWTRNVSHSTFFQNGTELKFLDIRRNSSGDYICHEVNTSSYDDDDRVVEVVTIDVQYAATFDMSKTTREVHENKQLDIVCIIDAHPPAKMTLMNNNTGVVLFAGLHGSGVIDIGFPTAQWNMTGEYVCSGYNLVNLVIATATADVTVLSRPIPDPNANMTYDVKSFLRKDTSFYMEFAGYPPPSSITWEYNGIALPSSQQQDTNTTSMLNITDVSIKDFGEYVITLTNEYGSSQATYTLLPDGPPQRPTDLEHFDVTKNSVTLRWKSGFDMGNRQHFTIWKQVGPNGFETISPPIMDHSTTHGINQTWTHVQTGLVSDTEYNLTVDAENVNEHYTSGLVKPPTRFRTLQGPPADDDGGVNVAVIVGPVVGGVCLIALIAFVLHLRRIQRRKARGMKPLASATGQGYKTIQ